MESSSQGKLRLAVTIALQLGVTLGGLAGIAFAPPAQGRILLVPLTASAEARLPASALGHDAVLLGSGPIRGSLVVMAGRDTPTWTMLRLGVLPVAAFSAGCGQFRDGLTPA